MIELKEHNQKPYEELCRKMDCVDKCALVSATGTGKSYIIGKYVEEHDLLDKTLMLVPTSRLRKEWEKLLPGISVRTYHWLCFGKKKSVLENMSLLVCDELHHLGADEWGAAYEKITDGYSGQIIGASATPIRFLDKGRNMIEECFDGNCVEGLSLPDAISCGVLPSMDYTTALYNLPDYLPSGESGTEITQSLYRQLDYMGSQYSFKRILSENLDGSKGHKVAVFVDCIDRISEIRELCTDIFPNASHYTVHSRMGNTDSVFDEFSIDSNMSFIYTVDMLNEGVHVSGVDTVVMFRKTESPTVYLQQLGRALKSDSGFERVKVFDFVANHTNLKSTQGGSGSVIEWLRQNIANPDRQIVVNDYALEELALLEKLRDVLNGAWSVEEDKVLVENYEGFRRLEKVAALLPHRSKNAIKARAKALGLESYRCWSKDEDNAVKKYYDGGRGIEKLSALLDGRSTSAIKNRAKTLRIVSEPAKPWTEAEDRIIRENESLEMDELSDLLPSRSPKAIAVRKRKLGIRTRENRKPWDKGEDDIILSNPQMEPKELVSLLPGRTELAIYARRSKLIGTEKEKGKPWTAEEDQTIWANLEISDDELSALLPGRSLSAICSHRSKIGAKKRGWSAEKEKRFRDLYENGGRNAVKNDAEFSNLSEGQIKSHASNRKYKNGKTNRWTEDELNKLRAVAKGKTNGKKTWSELATIFPRHTAGSIAYKVREIERENLREEIDK